MIQDEKQSVMFARVDEWKKSGKTVQEFTSDIGISKSSFKYWIRKKRDSMDGSKQFVELIPSVKPLNGFQKSSKANEAATQAQIEFTFASGLTVKVYG